MGPQRFQLHRSILAELGCTLPAGASVLDFGCGSGDVVAEYQRRGYQAVGCDIVLPAGRNDLFLIDPDVYAFPFADSSFDFVFSDQVLEHVRDHDSAFREIRRVLRSGAISLHIFPSKWKPVEDHLFVPFAGVLQRRWWLVLWAWLGIRNSFQTGRGFREVAGINVEYLAQHTRYLSQRQLLNVVSRYFDDIVFAERYLIKHSYGGARRIYPLTRFVPFLVALYRTFYSRAIVVKK